MTALTCLSYNILYQPYLKLESYPQLPAEVLTWEYRLSLIRRYLRASRADIIFLQEVDLANTTEDFKPLLGEYDYAQHHFHQKKRSSPMGNMTLWKKTTLKSVRESHNSCGIHVELQHLESGKTFWTQNVHLRARIIRGRPERVKQLTSCFRLIDFKLPGVIVGDYNDDFICGIDLNADGAGAATPGRDGAGAATPGRDGAATTGRDGATTPGRDGAATTAANLKLLLESKGLQVTSAGSTCWVPDKEEAGLLHEWCFDHVASTLDLKVMMKEQLLREGIPSATQPSNHYPIEFQLLL